MAETQYETYDPKKHDRDTPQETFGPVVRVDRHEDGQIHVITMNRPHRLNSIGMDSGRRSTTPSPTSATTLPRAWRFSPGRATEPSAPGLT